ncbi:hypothetical protein K525DRAFT_236954 [Schizophyllum commune Loenen D]|nr:hypothetical protein K525DRAFT_236954 [Schizophyllum commune Loenen D]
MWLGPARAGALGVLRTAPLLPCRTFSARAFVGAPRVPSPYRQFSWTRNLAARMPPGSRHPKDGTPELEKLSETVREQAQAEQAEELGTFYETVARPGVTRQVLWFVGFSAFAFSTAAWLTERSTNYWVDTIRYGSSWVAVTNLNLRIKQQQALVEKLRGYHRSIHSFLSAFPITVRANVSKLFVTIFQPIADASAPKKAVWKVVAATSVVFILQNIPRFQPFMRKYFVHSALSGMSITMLTSTFAHAEIIHFLVNMFALEGFGSSTAVHFMKHADLDEVHGLFEASPFWHFVAFFCVAGAFSSLTQHVVQVKVTYPRLIRQYAAALARQAATAASAVGRTKTWADAVQRATPTRRRWFPRPTPIEKPPVSEVQVLQGKLKRALLPSLGASGAVYSCLVITALAFPNAEVALFFPPGFSMNIQTGVAGAILFDLTGIVLGWSFMAHWAHLGGALFGYLYYYYGPDLWRDLRREVHAMALRSQGDGPVKRLA